MGSKLVWGELDSPPDLFSRPLPGSVLVWCRFQTILDLYTHCFQVLQLPKVHVRGQTLLSFGVQFSPENDCQYSVLTIGFFICFHLSILSCVYDLWLHELSVQVVCARVLSHSVFVTPWTAACPAPLSMGFPRQEYWSGLPFPPPGDLPDPGMGSTSPALAGGFFICWATWEAPNAGCKSQAYNGVKLKPWAWTWVSWYFQCSDTEKSSLLLPLLTLKHFLVNDGVLSVTYTHLVSHDWSSGFF